MLPKFPSVVLQEKLEAPPTCSLLILQLRGAAPEEPRQAFEVDSGDAVRRAPGSAGEKHRPSPGESRLGPLLPAPLREGKSDSCATAAPARGMGREIEPALNFFKPSATWMQPWMRLGCGHPLHPKGDQSRAKLLLV